MRAWAPVLFVIPFVAATADAPAQTGSASPLRVGAARIDVTPAAGDLPRNSQGILDRLYARAIVLEVVLSLTWLRR